MRVLGEGERMEDADLGKEGRGREGKDGTGERGKED